MKKLFALLIVALSVAFTANAQEKEKVEVKKTTTVVQKAKNPFTKNKKYKGYKVKHKHPYGRKHVKKVNTQTGEVKVKTDN